jgi:hypothetical protein
MREGRCSRNVPAGSKNPQQRGGICKGLLFSSGDLPRVELVIFHPDRKRIRAIIERKHATMIAGTTKGAQYKEE